MPPLHEAGRNHRHVAHAFHTRRVPVSQRRMEPMAERGFLVLADISGFTQFVAGSELEHGPPIIADLLEVVIDRLAPPLKVQEVEGDAVFAFGLDGAIVPATTALDVVDDAFVAFKALRLVPAACES